MTIYIVCEVYVNATGCLNIINMYVTSDKQKSQLNINSLYHYLYGISIVAHRLVPKRRLNKQRQLLSNARNNRKTMLCNPFLSNGPVDTRIKQ
jgi:hypothetical protein